MAFTHNLYMPSKVVIYAKLLCVIFGSICTIQ
jgi:hypothetical protein